MSKPSISIGQFFIRALIFLGPALFIWSAARVPLSLPTAWLADVSVALLFPGWATGMEIEGTHLSLLTNLQIEHESGRAAYLTPAAQILNYSYGLPLLVALLLASESKGWWWKAALGAMLLAPLHVLGICSSWLVGIAIHAQQATSSITGFTSTHQNVIAVLYQFSTLILPTLAPIAIWLIMEREFASGLVRKPGPETPPQGPAL